MYLKEIGKVRLLSADEEIELAQKMEAGSVAVEKIPLLKERLAETVMNRKKKKYKRRSKHCNWMSTVDQMPKNVWRRQIFVW